MRHFSLNRFPYRTLAQAAIGAAFLLGTQVALANTGKEPESEPQSLKADQVAPAVNALIGVGDKVLKRFDGPDGLVGWLVQPEGHALVDSQILYTTNSGEYVILGNVLERHDDHIHNLTEVHVKEYGFTPDLTALWERLEQSLWFAQGALDDESQAVLYVFNDLNCVYCHIFHESLLPLMEQGLQVRWLPVAILSPTSLPKAAALLQADDVGAAHAQGHARWKDKKSDAFASADEQSVIDYWKVPIMENSELMREAGGNGTPFTVFKGQDGQVYSQSGAVNPEQILKQMGLSEKFVFD